MEAGLRLAERPEAETDMGLALVDPASSLEVLDDALRAGGTMTLGCAGLLELSSTDLDRLGYTVFDMGVIPIRDTQVHSFNLADMRIAEHIGPCLFIIESQIDEAANVQPFGSHVESPPSDALRYNIGPARSLPSREQIAIEVPLADSWFPYLGMSVTSLIAPTTGNVHTRAIYINRRPC